MTDLYNTITEMSVTDEYIMIEVVQVFFKRNCISQINAFVLIPCMCNV